MDININAEDFETGDETCCVTAGFAIIKAPHEGFYLDFAFNDTNGNRLYISNLSYDYNLRKYDTFDRFYLSAEKDSKEGFEFIRVNFRVSVGYISETPYNKIRRLAPIYAIKALGIVEGMERHE